MPHAFGALEFFGGTKKTQPKTPNDRVLGTELDQILSMGQRLYDSEAALAPQYTELFAGNADRATRRLTGTYTDTLNELTPDALRRLRESNPGQANLYDTLLNQASTGLAQGGRLRPDDTNAIAKSVKGDYAGRGFSSGLPAAELEQAMQLYGSGEALRSQRQNFAQGVLEQGNQIYTAPAVAQANDAAGALLNMGGTYSATQPSVFEEIGGYASDVFNTNYNAKAASLIAGANNRAAILGGAQSY